MIGKSHEETVYRLRSNASLELHVKAPNSVMRSFPEQRSEMLENLVSFFVGRRNRHERAKESNQREERVEQRAREVDELEEELEVLRRRAQERFKRLENAD